MVRLSAQFYPLSRKMTMMRAFLSPKMGVNFIMLAQFLINSYYLLSLPEEIMSGFFGTSAGYNSDLSLIASLFFFIIGLVAFFQARNRKFTPHANLMVWAVLLNWIPVLLVMVPTALKIVQYDLKLTTGAFATMAACPRGDRHGSPARDDLYPSSG